MKCTIGPSELTCEYTVNPLGIDAVRPRLGWQVVSSLRNQAQTAYQILVASSSEKLAVDQGDLWDSGKVSSDQSIHLVYGGKPLTTSLRCYWKVRVWDKGDTASDFSAPAWWEMGLLSSWDWKGKWIGTDAKVSRTYHGLTYREAGNWRGKWLADDGTMGEIPDTYPAPLLRKEVELKKRIKNARVYIVGLGYYELSINGTKVGDHVLDPKFTAYDKRTLYVTYDVTSHMREGANGIGVILGNGWYNLNTSDPWTFVSAPWRSAPKLLFQLRVELEDGTVETVVSDRSWKIGESPIVWNDMWGGETYDARREKPGWDSAGYDDAEWMPAEETMPPFGKLVAQSVQPIKVTKEVRTTGVTELTPGKYIFDMGQIFSGWARLFVQGPAGTAVTLRFSQGLLPDGNIHEAPNRACLNETMDPGFRCHEDTYILKGEGVEEWEPKFVYHGFRYVEVTGFPGKPEADSLVGCVVHTAVENIGAFECSNPLLNQIMINTQWSFLTNLHGHPTDCPHREKNGWSGDAHLVAEQALYNYKMTNVYTQWMDDFHEGQKENGELPSIVPNASDWGYRLGIAWNSAYLLIPWYCYVYNGDIGILETHYDGMKKWMESIPFEAEGYIVPKGFDDWVPVDEKTPAEVTSTAYYYTNAMLLSKMAKLLGQPEDEQLYTELARKIKDAYNEHFYDADKGTYGNDTQTAVSCALFMDLVEEEHKPRVVESLVRKMNQFDGHINTGFLGAKYVPNALTKVGRSDLAYAMAAKKTFPGWGYWIECGLTTLSEQWDHTIENNSWNHPSFGDIVAWFYKALAGINADESQPGFKHFLIRPYPVGELTYVRGEYGSVRGRILSEWRRDGDTFQLKIDIPANTTATIYVPALDNEDVTEGNGHAHESEGVRFVRMEESSAVYSVGSGKYMFASKLGQLEFN